MVADSQSLTSREERQQAALSLARQARRQLLVFSHQLEPLLYDQPEFIEAVKQLVLSHPRCRAAFIVQNIENLRQQDHRLLTLVQRLPSRLQIRLSHQDYREHPETFLLCDDRHLLIETGIQAGLPNPGSRLYQDQPRLNEEYQRLFTRIWEQSEDDISLRRLSL